MLTDHELQLLLRQVDKHLQPKWDRLEALEKIYSSKQEPPKKRGRPAKVHSDQPQKTANIA